MDQKEIGLHKEYANLHLTQVEQESGGQAHPLLLGTLIPSHSNPHSHKSHKGPGGISCPLETQARQRGQVAQVARKQILKFHISLFPKS